MAPRGSVAVVTEDQTPALRKQIAEDRKLIEQAADALAQISRGLPFSNEHADVLTALRIRLEGKKRSSLEELLETTTDLGVKGKPAIEDVLQGDDPKHEWPTVQEKKKDWPGL